MPSQQASQSSGSQSGQTSSSSSNPPSKYRVIKDGWGSRPNFQASYGLTMDPDDIEEGNAILDAMMQHEYGNGNGTGNNKK